MFRVTAGDGFGERLAKESEKHMFWIAKTMEDGSIEPMIWELNKLKHVMKKFERILEEEQDQRERRLWWEKEK